ncbi:HCP-like protein, partial [Suillus bovinus]|uniref:HCP-like protein n=1 Tax=Suillus bovinus TaxID=48563 RepID=UPI001B863019
SLSSPSHVHLPSHPPSVRPSSPASLYSTSYSFYRLSDGSPSPTGNSQFPTHSPSPSSNRSHHTEPSTPQEYLQLGIQYHEANKLQDSAFYFEKSAKEQGGCGIGMLMWGLTLRHGWGCEKNEKSGFKWLTKAAESAVDDLGKAREGMDVKAVRSELILAIYEVGQCFFHGWGIAKDYKMAVSYYRVAANLGDGDAQEDLAFCLANGKGCKRDKKEAARWYRAAVEQGASDVGMAWIYKDKY